MVNDFTKIYNNNSFRRAKRPHAASLASKSPSHPNAKKERGAVTYSAYGFFFLCMKSFNFTYKKYKFEKIKTELKIKFGLKEINLP